MDGYMASADVKEELTGVKVQLATLEANHVSINDTLGKVSEAVVNQVRISEQIVALNRRHDDNTKAVHKRLDKVDLKVDSNHTQIMKWSGGMGALLGVLSVAGLAVSIFRLVG